MPVADIEILEIVFEKWTGNFSMAPYKTPKGMLYLECGLIPIRFINWGSTLMSGMVFLANVWLSLLTGDY